MLLCAGARAQGECPDLTPFHEESAANESAADWQLTLTRLGTVFGSCLRNSEYFALYGAAQLYSGSLDAAIESLERALLFNPNNGGAMIDYAQALLQDGQLFAAIEANQLVLARQDTPPSLAEQIAERQRNWQALTRQTSWQLDLLGGYDDNLNGAPDQDLITLTLSGESVLLTLSPEFQAARGSFLNLRVQGQHRRLGPENQHDFIGEFRGRFSEDSGSDLTRFSTRYHLLRGAGRASWQFNSGIEHLAFGGKLLFTGTDAGFRYQFADSEGCRPYYGGALQHQFYHDQNQLNGLEVKAGVGNNCSVSGVGNQRVNAEISLLHNRELQSNRLGGSRNGWRFVVDWQHALSPGILSAQLSYTRLRDERGFSSLLANRARRDIERSALLLQYQQALPVLGPGARLLVNLYHQYQASNLQLFEIRDTSLEFGISWRF